jgi:hypothetical protein
VSAVQETGRPGGVGDGMNRRNLARSGIDGGVRWHRSSSCYDGNCVEVAVDGDAVLLRDSKHPDEGEISVNLREWAAFLEIVRDTCPGDSFDAVVAASGSAAQCVRDAGSPDPSGGVDCAEL